MFFLFIALLSLLCIGLLIYFTNDQSTPKSNNSQKTKITRESPQVQLATSLIVGAISVMDTDPLLPLLTGMERKRRIKAILDNCLAHSMDIKPALAKEFGMSYQTTHTMIEWTFGELYQEYILN